MTIEILKAMQKNGWSKQIVSTFFLLLRQKKMIKKP